jgi:hypothetical protein
MTPFDFYLAWLRLWCSFWFPPAPRIKGRDGNVVRVNFSQR